MSGFSHQQWGCWIAPRMEVQDQVTLFSPTGRFGLHWMSHLQSYAQFPSFCFTGQQVCDLDAVQIFTSLKMYTVFHQLLNYENQLSTLWWAANCLHAAEHKLCRTSIRQAHTCLWFLHTCCICDDQCQDGLLNFSQKRQQQGKLDPLVEKESFYFKAWSIFRNSSFNTSKMSMTESSKDVWMWLEMTARDCGYASHVSHLI